MTHKVVVGGFASDERQIRRVTQSFSEFYDEDVEGMSFRTAMNDQLALDKLTRSATVFTHSAGMLAIKDTMPHVIVAVAPPVPTPVRKLITKAGKGAGNLLFENSRRSLTKQGLLFARGLELGLEVVHHPVSNLGRLGVISTFDAIQSGIAAQAAGITTDIAFMENDQLFNLSEANGQKAKEAGLTIINLHGGHEKFLFEPDKLIAEYDAIKQIPHAA